MRPRLPRGFVISAMILVLEERGQGDFMVTRFISFLSEKVNGLHQAAYVIAGFTFLSQILGLFRDRMLAALFGAGMELDVYYAAFRIPDLVFAAIASLVSLFVLIPFLSRKLNDGGTERAREFLSSVATVFGMLMILVVAVLWFFIPSLSRALYPGFSPDAYELLISLTRVLLLSPLLLGFSNILASVTQLTKRFSVYALSPIVYNFGIILGIVFLYPFFGLTGVVYGVIVGSVLHILVQIPAVIRERLMPRIRIAFDWTEIWELTLVSIPRTATLALNQAALLVLVGFASLMPEGSITVFNLASNLQLAPLSIIGVSYSVAAFPTLATLFSNGNRQAFLDHMLSAVRHVLFWSFPAITLVIVLRAHIVRSLLGSGAFDWSATRLTAAALALFIISLVAHSLMLLFVRGYYASGKTARPLGINIASSVLIVLLGFGFMKLFLVNDVFRFFIEALFRVEDVPGSIVLMLPLAYSIGMILNALAFWFFFRKDFGGHVPGVVYTTLWQSFSASVIAGFVAYLILRVFGPIVGLETVGRVFGQGLLAGISGIFAGAGVLYLLGNVEIREIFAAAKNRFRNTQHIVPETEEL